MVHSSQRGFSLLEVMIALVIFVLIGTTAYGVLTQLTHSKIALEQKSLQLEELQNTVLMMQHDAMQMTPRLLGSVAGGVYPAYTIDAKDYALDFTRIGLRNPLDDSRSTLARIHYGMRQGKWLREVWLTNNAKNPVFSEFLAGNLSAVNFQVHEVPETQAGSAILPAAMDFGFTLNAFGPLRITLPLVDAP